MSTGRSPRPFWVTWVARALIVALLSAGVLDSMAAKPAAPIALQAQASNSLRSQIRNLESRVKRILSLIRPMERSRDRYRAWNKCISWLRVSEYGDQDHRFGFHYDERDGTGLDFRPALAVDTSGGRPDFMFLKFAHRDECQSDTTKPGTPGRPGTADPALAPDTGGPRPVPGAGDFSEGLRDTTSGVSEVGTTARKRSLRARVRKLERQVKNIRKRARRLNRMAERFDEWESCHSQIGVTEYGDPENHYGYLFEDGETGLGFMPALAVDISEWDDPDYFVLAFAGRNRPFVNRECESEPGEGVD